MNSMRMRYFFLAPMAVLAMVACAKRDSDFAKRAADAKATTNKPSSTDKPADKPADKARDKVVDKPADPADKYAYQLSTEGLYQKNCKNQIIMEVQEDEKELVIDDVVTKDKGSYELQSTELYTDRGVKDSQVKHQLYLTGSKYELPKDFKEKAVEPGKITVGCHTVKADEADGKMWVEVLELPHEISTLDGSVTIYRKDLIEIGSKATIRVASTLYAKDDSLKQLLSGGGVQKSLIVKHENGDITIKLQVTTKDKKTDAETNIFMSGLYKKVI